MEQKIYADRLERQEAQIKKQSLTIKLLIGANIILGLTIAANYNREKIILSPPVAPEYKMFVTKGSASDTYLTALSRYVLDLMLNITPENADAQKSAVMDITAPDLRPSLTDKLNKIISSIKENNLSQNFYIENITTIQGKNIVFIRGVLYQYINGDSAAKTPQLYKLTFSVNNYNVELTDISLAQENDELLKGQ